MNRILIYVTVAITFSTTASAESLQNIICNNFKNIDLNNEELVLEKAFLLNDYIIYNEGGVSAVILHPLWENPQHYNLDIHNVSLTSMPEDVKNEFKQIMPSMIELPQDIKTSALSKFVSNLTQCPSQKIKTFAENLKKKLFNEERNIYNQRMKGRQIFSKSISIFTLSNQMIKPSKDYIYKYDKYQSNSVLLKVTQTLPDGVLVHAYVPAHLRQYFKLTADKNILIKTTKTYADEDTLENGYYEYIGTTSYTNVLGSISTVHTFQEIQDPMYGLHLFHGQN